ncbi:MAG: hypothetical protein LBC09_04975, partial [Helicobacteraceae bacterium]|nr:hypothetical protein [Helicobacteraceae bacterium]
MSAFEALKFRRRFGAIAAVLIALLALSPPLLAEDSDKLQEAFMKACKNPTKSDMYALSYMKITFFIDPKDLYAPPETIDECRFTKLVYENKNGCRPLTCREDYVSFSASDRD